ncbi:4-hydroxy-tetrahydrodipicolinate synthase [Nocardia inohanensis]|uniref:4-hydroxy-tetrahydrodipicolinate synthase n=1 Tax=Nocardia inohanensis TaxID=209246 RepID=UPI000836BCCD|nr:4-hydroxy-tetrahydrodipicolinate synthase [Nocardia inohanensis]
MTFQPTGIFAPLVTPFTDTGELAAADLERLAHSVIQAGVAGLVALGTTAEAPTLTPEERREVVRICGKVCREHEVPLIVGAGSNDTAATARALTALADESEATAVLSVVPYYTRPTEAGIVAHFEHLADRSPLPLVLYNVPYRTGRELGWEAIVRLGSHPNIVGVKQAVGTVDTDTARLFAECPEAFSILAGEDTLVSPLLAMGAAGGILATANIFPAELAELCRLWQSGKAAAARALGNSLVAPAGALFTEPNPTVIKAVLHAQGRISAPTVRLPLLPAGVPAIFR